MLGRAVPGTVVCITTMRMRTAASTATGLVFRFAAPGIEPRLLTFGLCAVGAGWGFPRASKARGKPIHFFSHMMKSYVCYTK